MVERCDVILNKRRTILTGLVLVGLLAAEARVFRLGGNREDRLNTVGLPWQEAYSTTMDVDGQRQALHAYSSHRDEPMLDQMKGQFEAQGAKVSLQEFPGGVRGTAEFEEQTVRFLVLPPGGRPNQMAFVFYPEPAAAGNPAKLPVPLYPGAEVESRVANESTGTMCATMQTMDGPDQVQAFYADALFSNGWKTVIPPMQGESRMAIYQRGEQVCTVFSKFRPGFGNRVTVLVKAGGL